MDQTRHQDRLLARATFGERPGDREHIRRVGAEAWLETALASLPRGDAELESRLARFPALSYGPADWLATDDLPDPAAASPERRPELLAKLHVRAVRTGLQVAGARVVRAVHGRDGLREVMADFWANHFSVDARKGIVGGLLPHYQREAIDRHALGRFDDLLLAVAKSPAMLFYLDNWSSTAATARRPPGPGAGDRPPRSRGINENYARELMELHTLGIDGGYTQDDVISVARALTGWSLESRRSPVYRFHAFLHDAGQKRVLGEALSGDGEAEGEALLRRLARHPATARHVSRKLVARFVADRPPQALVDRAAARFLETEGDIPSVLRAVLLAPALADPSNRKLKTPLRLFASALRASGGSTDGSEETLLALARMGELPFFARTPAGFPEASERWIDPGAVLERMKLAFALARGSLSGARLGAERFAPAVSRGAAPPEGPLATAVALAAPEFQWC